MQNALIKKGQPSRLFLLFLTKGGQSIGSGRCLPNDLQNQSIIIPIPSIKMVESRSVYVADITCVTNGYS
ncbi:hypothetical protein BSSC8_26640 [Bacillus subtilis subsp. subtilis str. SC-8]|nr:hypothetical protein BSSC8_26640 [Bacillus subtilis subsp. subtilis str. SC-8]